MRRCDDVLMRAVLRSLAVGLVASLVLCVPAHARHGRGGGLVGGTNPLSLPLLTTAQASTMFQFLGSFTVPSGSFTGLVYGGGALSLSGTTMYMSSLVYEPVAGNEVEGIGSFTPPSTLCSGYAGGSTCVATIVSSPSAPGTSPPTTYALTSGYTSGSTCAVFSSLPPGIAANAGWYLAFNGLSSATDDELVTSVGTCNGANSVGWATALSASYSTSVYVYQWNPYALWSNSTGGIQDITGSMVEGGKLYVTGGGEYDGNCTGQLGWIATTSPSLSGTWNAVNTTGQNAVTYIGRSAAQSSRYLAGPLSITPSIWTSLLGDNFESGGPGFSVVSCAQSWGPAFQSFNVNNVSDSGGAVPVIAALGYYDAANEQIGGRVFSGPFPDQNGYSGPYYPATLSTIPAQNDTSETLVLPTTVISFTATVATTGEMNVTAFTSGAFSNNAITYDLTGTGIPTGATMQPAFDYSPGATLTTGNYWEGDTPTTAISSETLTATPAGFQGAPAWTVFFSDGSSAIGTINGSTFTPLAPLTGCVSTNPCTTSVTLAPMGDQYFSVYDGQNGGGFIVPGTSTYVAFFDHNYGIQRPKNSKSSCDPSSSESWWTPLYPDTQNYQTIGMYLFNMADLVAGYNGSQQPYAANPYGYLSFPDEANLVPTSCVIGTLGSTYAIGWSYFDAATDIWYVATGRDPTIIDEYKVTPP